MTIRTLLLAMCVLASGTALAQPGPTAEPSPPDGQPPQPVEPPVAPPPQVLPQPPLPHPRPLVTEPLPAPEPPPTSPSGFSLGIGVGYRFPTSLQMPNVTSVRLRFEGGFTLEPTFVFANSSHSVDTGSPMTSTATEFGLGALARIPVVRHRRTDLEILAAVDLDNLSEDPDDANPDDVTSTTTTSIRYGVAVGEWITPHVQASLSATNAFVTYTKKRQEMGVDSVVVTSDTTFGLTFNPTVVLMIHLYN